MKYIFSLIIILCQSVAFTQSPSVLFNSKQFNLPNDSLTLVENYLSIAPASVKYIPNNGGQLESNIEIIQIYKQADKIIDFKKYVLKGGTTTDSVAIDIMDQQRFTLKPDTYDYELEIKDLNNTSSEPVQLKETIEVIDYNKQLGFSDIQLIDYYEKTDRPNEFSKSGYNIIPLIANHLPNEIIKMAYYSELYNSDKVGESFLLVQFIEDYETSRQLRKYAKMNKTKGTNVVPVLNVFNINELPSGKYNLVIQLKDKNNVIIAEKKLFFTRENPTRFDINNFLSDEINNTFVSDYPDSLMSGYVDCLMPLASNLEASIIKRSDSLDVDMKKRFFYSFWKERDAENPEEKWLAYKVEVNKVEKLFSTQIKHGYETDRGRIHLKFGPPNTRAERPSEPNSYPYEIWHYYKIGRFNNKRFVFFQPDLVTNDYELLHSDYPGERNNYRWKIDLQKRSTPFNSIDDTNTNNSTWGSQGDDLFTNPR